MDASLTLWHHGLRNTRAVVSAAHTVGLPLNIAAAFVEQESRGLMIYGHDSGGLFPGEPVNKENYAQFVAAVDRGHTSNGVGLLQITYPGYFTDASQRGFKLWEPEDNARYGFEIIKGLLNGHSLNQAAQLYNSGRTSGAPAYGASVVAKAARWQQLLA